MLRRRRIHIRVILHFGGATDNGFFAFAFQSQMAAFHAWTNGLYFGPGGKLVGKSKKIRGGHTSLPIIYLVNKSEPFNSIELTPSEARAPGTAAAAAGAVRSCTTWSSAGAAGSWRPWAAAAAATRTFNTAESDTTSSKAAAAPTECSGSRSPSLR